MTYDNPQLLELLPTSTTSPYFRGSLHAVFRTLFENSHYDFKEGTFKNDKDVLFVCRAILSGRDHAQQQSVVAAQRTAEALDRGDHEQRVAQDLTGLRLAERQTRGSLISLQALDIGSGIAQFVEEPCKGEKKGVYLPVVGSVERNESLEIYARLWDHLGAYADELNADPAKVTQSFALGFEEGNATMHFKDMTIETKRRHGQYLARLGNVAVFGALQGTPEQPIGVNLTLVHVPVASLMDR